mmetsp:Transcript_49390/g.67310  ORF Transcript_49390/g.67310 Transcript_49390/m.67310 type:complete len:81 (+) Transcript_49390:81-323(+)
MDNTPSCDADETKRSVSEFAKTNNFEAIRTAHGKALLLPVKPPLNTQGNMVVLWVSKTGPWDGAQAELLEQVLESFRVIA